MFLQHTAGAPKNSHLLTNSFCTKPSARITASVSMFFLGQHCYRKKQRAAISFQKVSCLRQTKQRAVNSRQLPLLLLQLVRNSVWFPVKLQRKTKQMRDPQPCSVSLDDIKDARTTGSSTGKQQWGCEQPPELTAD